MNFLKQYWLILAILILVTLLVLIRSFSRESFRYDAVKWAEPSSRGSNMVTEDQIPSLGGDILLINLGHDTPVNFQFPDKTMMINPELILKKTNLALIRKNKGPVILFSDDSSVPARVWMVVSEMGIKNIYILSEDYLGNE